MTTDAFDVVISGYGPTGQAAASLLAGRGHRVCVFERWPSLYGLPRLCTIDGEAARVVQAAGDIDAALRDSNPCRRYLLVNENDDILMDIDWTEDHVCGYPLRISMHQPDIEDAMDSAARERGAEINQGYEVTNVEQTDDGVRVTARERIAGEDDTHTWGDERVVTASYMIGADGARSATRESLGIPSEDVGFASAWLSVDATRKRTLPTLQHAPEMRIPVVTMAPEGRGRAFIPIGASRLRFEFWVDPDSDHAERLNPELGYKAIEDAYGLTKDDIEIYRTVIYPFTSKIASTWRQGNVFLAGDAAHLMTPFLGQGACASLRDAVNLSWKLDLVLRGLSDKALLDTYEAERRPHATAHVIGSSELGRVALEPDPEAAAQRDAFMLSGQAPPPPPDPVLTNGILHRAATGEVALPVGDLAPQGTITAGERTGRFDDVLGWGFQLIGRDSNPADDLSDEQRRVLDDLGAVVVGTTTDASKVTTGVVLDVDGAYERYFDQTGFAAFISRPDFVLFGGVATKEETPQLVDDLREQLLLVEDGVLSGAAA